MTITLDEKCLLCQETFNLNIEVFGITYNLPISARSCALVCECVRTDCRVNGRIPVPLAE